jgi:hypothetical protein
MKKTSLGVRKKCIEEIPIRSSEKCYIHSCSKTILEEANCLSSQRIPHGHRDGILGAITAGAFLVLVGSMFIIHPNLIDKVIDFFNDIKLVNILDNNSIMLPAPANVALHVDVYSAVEQFSLAWGVFLVAMLVIRFAVSSPTRRRAENISDVIFWFGTAYLIQTWLIDSAKWFEFWAMILILLGVSLIVRAVYLAAVGLAHK